MVIYIIKSGLCLLVVLASYHLLLEDKKMHQFNRGFLLFGLAFSFIVPLLELSLSVDFFQYLSQTNTTVGTNQNNDSQYLTSGEVTNSVVNPLNKPSIFLMLTYLISGILLIRFCYKVAILIRKALSNERINYKGAKLVLLKEKILPHTFGKYIFLNESDYRDQKIDDAIFTHELTHARERHSLDIVIVEALRVLFWFNPLLIFYKKAIQLNHEFIADDQVLKSHKGVRDYQELLLAKLAYGQIPLASNLNFSVTKKRLRMMTKKNRSRTTVLFASTTIPILVCLLMLFSCGKNENLIQDEHDPVKIAQEISNLSGSEDTSLTKYNFLELPPVRDLDELKENFKELVADGTITFYGQSGKEISGERVLNLLGYRGTKGHGGFSFAARIGKENRKEIYFQGFE